MTDALMKRTDPLNGIIEVLGQAEIDALQRELQLRCQDPKVVSRVIEVASSAPERKSFSFVVSHSGAG
jgi:hypothetical protein